MNRRKSKQRDAVHDAVMRCMDHPNADQVFDQVRTTLPSISLGTVYRNLGVLVEEGTLLEVSTEGGAKHYDANPGLHAHVVCDRCGRIADLMIPESLRSVVKEGQRLTGYRINENHVHLSGVCPICENAVPNS